MFIRLFPIWAILLSSVAYLFPQIFIESKYAIEPLLILVMFGMGITLLPKNFDEVLERPLFILLGIVLQFGVMPLAAWIISKLLGLPVEFFIGMMLVGCCSGGTASNIICYLAKGDMALSIVLTTISTFMAILATPILALFYIGHDIGAPMREMLITIFWVILLPVCSGIVLNMFLEKNLEKVKAFFPNISMLAIVFIIAIIVALNKNDFNQISLLLCLGVIMHNSIGLLSGYWITRFFVSDKNIARTMAIEVGMQNSGLAIVLALKYYSAAAALPGALFSIWHYISGSAIAAYWSRASEKAGAVSENQQAE